MKIIKYKMVDKDGYTRRGEVGETYWLDGKEKIAIGEGNKLCSKDVIHYYDHPLLAVLFNPIHANIVPARIIEIKIDREIAHDGLKGGCKKAKHVKEIKLPAITEVQRVTFAIKLSLEYYVNEAYGKWAKNWLNGKGRAESAAESAARSAVFAAESAAESAAVFAARAAESAAESAARLAACPAESAAESAARLARSAARSAESVASAARSAEKINKLFIKTIKEIANE